MALKQRRANQDTHKRNRDIKYREVRIVSFEDKEGVYSIGDALRMAEEADMDLIEITPNANPPVCKIMLYTKFKYEQKKREKDNKKNSKAGQLKEIKFGPNTGDHDFEFKLKHAKGFLEKGNKVKAYVQFKGREMQFRDKGELLLLKLASELDEIGKIDELPKMSQKRMIMMISPRVKK